MTDEELLRALREVEQEMGRPGFWEQGVNNCVSVGRYHTLLTREADRRGLHVEEES